MAAARRLEAGTGRRAVAVFWIEGDDHDFEEIRTAWVLDRAGAPRPLRYEPREERAGLPAFRRLLDDSIRELLAELGGRLPPTEFTGGCSPRSRTPTHPGRPLSEAFGRFLLHCTRDTGLIVMDPTTPALKRLAYPAYETAARHEAEGRRRIAARTRRIEAAGFRGQAVPEGYGIFRPRAGRGSGAGGDEGGGGRTPGQVLDGPPELLSAAVLLRPLVQDFLLPTAAYVGGASEIAYHAQIGGLYELHGIPRPLVAPRHQVSILGASHTPRARPRTGIGSMNSPPETKRR